MTHGKLKFLILGFIPSYVYAEGSTLKELSSTLVTGGSVLTKIIWAACIVVGIMLIAAAFTQFQIHRRNPKLVPLTTPVMYLLLGIAAISIPFIQQASSLISGVEPPSSPPPSAPPSSSGAPPPPPNYNPNDIDSPMY